MANRENDKNKKKNAGGGGSSGRPGTKFMERPQSGETRDPAWSDDENALERQEGSETEMKGGQQGGQQGQPGQQPGKQGQGKPGMEKKDDSNLGKEEDSDERE